MINAYRGIPYFKILWKGSDFDAHNRYLTYMRVKRLFEFGPFTLILKCVQWRYKFLTWRPKALRLLVESKEIRVYFIERKMDGSCDIVFEQEFVRPAWVRENYLSWSNVVNPGNMVQIEVRSSVDGSFVGDPQAALYYLNRGFTNLHNKKRDSTCTACLGWHAEENKWYGWGHRAIYGFGVGSTSEPGNVQYQSNDPEEIAQDLMAYHSRDPHPLSTRIVTHEDGSRSVEIYGMQDETTYKEAEDGELITTGTEIVTFSESVKIGRGSWMAKTLDDAYEMAYDFAEGVS